MSENETITKKFVPTNHNVLKTDNDNHIVAKNISSTVELNSSFHEMDVYGIINMRSLKNFDDFLKEFPSKEFTANFDDSFNLKLDYTSVYNIVKNFGELALYQNRYYSKYKNCLCLFNIDADSKKTQFSYDIYGHDMTEVLSVANEFYKSIETYIFDENHINLKWLYMDENKQSRDHDVQVKYDDVVLAEAYPFIENFSNYIDNYLNSEETILVLQGEPGTGKTRLIRQLLTAMSKFHNGNKYFGFTTSPELIDKETFYMQFLLSDGYGGMVLEDSDTSITSRKKISENTTISKMLFASDGFIPHNKKIILSTNLDVTDIDDAITRSGRCYDFVKTRKLSPTEIRTFMDAYNKKFNLSVEIREFHQDAPLCDVYKAIKNTTEKK